MNIVRAAGLIALATAVGSGLSACGSSSSRAATPLSNAPATSVAAVGAAPTAQPTTGSSPTPATTALSVAIPTDKPLPAALAGTETLTISNPGPAIAAAKVQLDLGKRLTGPGVGLTGLKLERLDPSGGSWVGLTLTDDSTAPGVYLASYTSDIPTGTSTQQLRITANTDVPMDFKVSANGAALADQQATIPVVSPELAVVAAPKTAQRGGVTEFDFTLTNSTSATYPVMDINLNINCGTATIACNMPGGHIATGFKVDWYDGSSWQPLKVAGTSAAPDAYVTDITSGPLAPGTTDVKLRLSFGPDLDPRAATGDFQVGAGLPFTGVGMPSDLTLASAMFSIK